MKKNIIIVLSICALALFTGCATAGGNVTQDGQNFTGDGGKEISLTILAPGSSGLEANQAYIPILAQVEFVNNFSEFSAISVLDRVRLEEQYADLSSQYYSGDEGMDLGHLTPTSHIMGGSITRTATGYALQMQITNSADKMTVASYSGTFKYAELENLSCFRRASLDLLQKLGVTLTAQAQAELSNAASSNHIKAQTSLAQGITAQRSGNEFEALSSFFTAKSFDTNVSEASQRITDASNTLVSNNWQNTSSLQNNSGSSQDNSVSQRDRLLGEIETVREETQRQAEMEKEQQRNEKERRKNINALLKQATAYYKTHQPFEINMPGTFNYGNINHQKGTVDITVSLEITPIAEEFEILQQLEKHARSIGVEMWPFNNMWGSYDTLFTVFSFGVWGIVWGGMEIDNYVTGLKRSGIWKCTYNNISDEFRSDPEFSVVAIILNEQGKQLKKLSFRLKDIFTADKLMPVPSKNIFSMTFSIKPQDLTDTLTMQIVSINGKSVQSGYVRIPEPVKVLSAASNTPNSQAAIPSATDNEEI